MKSKRILNALGQADEFYVDEAANIAPTPKKYHWTRWGALVACLCLVIGGALHFTGLTKHSHGSYDSFPDEVTVSENGVTIPPTKVTLEKENGAEYCWAYAFFIYQGRCYKSYDRVYGDSDLIGEYLGTARGMIDVWTPKEGYVELAGNIKGDFYSVKGYDPEFMVCMRENNGAVNIFINDNDLTLKHGSDLLEKRFHLSGSLNELVYQNHDSWNYSKGELYSLTNRDAVSDFISLLNQGTFIPEAQALLSNNAEHLAQATLYHVDLHRNDGTTIELRLCSGGYVSFGMYVPEVCIKVDETEFNQFIALLDGGADAVPTEAASGVYCTEDECRDDPYFGTYIPTYIPDNMSFEHATIQYEIEPKTGNILRTEEISLTYRSEDDSKQYYISIADVNDYGNIGWAGVLLTPEALTPQAVDQFSDTSFTDFGLQLDDILVAFTSYGLDAEESYQIMSSINK